MHRFPTIAVACLIVATAAVAGAQQPRAVRSLTVAGATVSSVTFRDISQIREISRGRLLVHDEDQRIVVLLDSALRQTHLAIDSIRGRSNSYSREDGWLLPYTADSTLFVDPADRAFMVLDENGVFARVKAVPIDTDEIEPGDDRRPTFHVSRGLIFSISELRVDSALWPPRGSPDRQKIMEDSIQIVAVDMRTRRLDTVAAARVGLMSVRIASDGDTETDDFGLWHRVDDYAVLPDGTIGIVRGKDYHVDWVAPDGSVRSSPPVAFEWHRPTDEQRKRLTDSMTIVRDRQIERMEAEYQRNLAEATARGRPIDPEDIPFKPAPFASSEIPEAMPAFSRGAVHADADGNLWIRIDQFGGRSSDPDVFDVVNRDGVLVDRIRMPAGRTLVGFGKGGHVYLRSSGPNGGDRLERLKAR
jgi:hypothetical protein